jgi:dipeptidyl aminopeptidase/acylaminoacyl peptidase
VRLPRYALTLLFCIGLDATADPPPSIADFARLPEYEMAKISPNGTHLAVSLRREGRLAIVVLRRDTLAVTAAVNFDAPNEVDTFFWANTSRLVVSAARQWGALDFPVPTGEFLALDADGSRERWILRAPAATAAQGALAERAGARPEPVREIHVGLARSADPDHVLVNRVTGPDRSHLRSELVRIDAYTGRETRVVRGPPGSFRIVADSTLTTFVATKRSADLSIALQRRTRRDRGWQDWQRVAFADGVVVPVAIDQQGRTWLLDSAASETSALVARDGQGRAEHRFADPGVDVDHVMIDADSGAPYAVRYVAARPRYGILDDSELARHVERALRAFPDAWLWITSHTADRQLAVIEVRTDAMAPRFYISDARTDSVEFLLDSRRWLAPTALAKVEPVQFAARDGTRLHGYLARIATDVPLPLIVLAHGGPHFVRDDGQFDEWVQLLATHGYAVLQVNFRGSGGYGKTHLAAGYGHWGDLILDDLADGVRWALAQGVTAPGRQCIAGASFGAYAALMSAARTPDLYVCAIGFAGPYDLADLLEHGDVSGHRLGLAYLTAVLGRERDALDAISPLHEVKRIRIPVLLGHGVLDPRVPVRHARRLAKALAAQGTPIDLVEFPGETHGLARPASRERWFAAMLAFLRERLPVDGDGHSL